MGKMRNNQFDISVVLALISMSALRNLVGGRKLTEQCSN